MQRRPPAAGTDHRADRALNDLALTGLGRRLAGDIARMVRLDIALAVASAGDVLRFASQGTVMMLAGTLVGIVGLVLLLWGVGLALSLILPEWLVAVIGGVALLAAAIPVTWRSWHALKGG